MPPHGNETVILLSIANGQSALSFSIGLDGNSETRPSQLYQNEIAVRNPTTAASATRRLGAFGFAIPPLGLKTY
jgi:hypothetical protein